MDENQSQGIPRPADSNPPIEVHHADGNIEHPLVRYEITDVRWQRVVVGILVAAGLAALHFYVVLKYHNYRQQSQRELYRSSFPLAQRPTAKLPDHPRLEPLDQTSGTGHSEFARGLAAQERLLRSAGLADEEGFVHIPIDRAMEILADTLPVRDSQPPGPVKDNGLVDGGEPNSGRLLRGAAP
jgi:hypothetical protein